jgi:Ca2+-binding RTX toxin-like protein
MKTTVFILLTAFVFSVSAPAWAARTDTREERWDRPADELAGGISGIEDVIGPFDYIYPREGTADNDVLVGDDDRNHIRGLDGDDEIFGRGGDDIIEGGNDDDILNGEAGDDYIRGGPGRDEIRGEADDDMLLGGPGPDTFYPGPGDDVVLGQGNGDIVHYSYEDNLTSSDFYDGGTGFDLVSIYVPGDFDVATANDIEMQFIMHSGNLDLAPWGIALILVNFEDMVFEWGPAAGRDSGDGQPLAARETTWGGIKALYR